MATWKTLTNEVLVKLRESQLGSSETIASNTYASLIATFVNDAKREVEDAWNWTDLRAPIQVSTVSGTDNVVFAGTNSRTKLLSLHNLTENYELRHIKSATFDYATNIGNTTNSKPYWYRPRGVDSSGLKKLELYPTPNAVYLLEGEFKNPDDEFTDDADVLTLQGVSHVIVQKAWAIAISERGEDGGQLFDEVTKRGNDYLADAIMLDKANTMLEADWEVI